MLARDDLLHLREGRVTLNAVRRRGSSLAESRERLAKS